MTHNSTTRFRCRSRTSSRFARFACFTAARKPGAGGAVSGHGYLYWLVSVQLNWDIIDLIDIIDL
jgi:hypothetical protein